MKNVTSEVKKHNKECDVRDHKNLKKNVTSEIIKHNEECDFRGP